MGRERVEEIVRRLRRLEGQVQGIERMVREGRYCIDILTQLAAVRGAVQEVQFLLLRGHFETCVAGAIRSGNKRARERQIQDIIAALGRMKH